MDERTLQKPDAGTELWIGIDPGESNGIATYTRRNGLVLDTMTFWQLIDRIDNLDRDVRTAEDVGARGGPSATNLRASLHFIVEDPNLNTFMFGRNTGHGNRADAKIAQNTGMNKQDAKRLIQRIRHHKFNIELVRPNPASSKWTSEYFERLWRSRHSGEPPRSNQHNRDAAKLISHKWI